MKKEGNSIMSMKSEEIDKKTALIISLQVFMLGAKNCLISGVPFLFSINDSLNKIITVFVGIFYIYAFWITRGRHLSSKCIIFWIFIIFSFLFTFVVFPQNIPYITSSLLRVVTVMFMTSILLSKMKDFSWLKYYMTLFAYPTIIAGCIAGFFLKLIGHGTTATYDGDTYVMSLSYAVLIPVMWLLHDFFKCRKKISLLFALIGLLIILLFGSRNPLLAIGAYVFFEVVDIARRSQNKIRRIFYKISLLAIVVIAFFYKQVIRLMLGITSFLGVSSRTLELLSSDEIDLSNRDTIHEQLWDLINANPILGLGIQGDLANMNEMAHGLFLSILCTYGYIIGIGFILALCINCLSALRRSKGLDHQILVIYMCLVFPRGFTGGDMWGSDIFWWLIAFVYVALSKKYHSKNSSVTLD